MDNDSEVFLVTAKCQSLTLIDSGLHGLLDSDVTAERELVCVEINKLLDYYPLSEYKVDNLAAVPLHHSIQR